jgi:hypothetical protein
MTVFLFVFSLIFCVNNSLFSAKTDDAARFPERSQTFLATRPIDYTFLTRALRRSTDYKKGNRQVGITVVGTYQKSIRNDDPTHYFLFDQKDSLLVSGDNNILELDTRDIRAEWLELDSHFLSNLTLQPTQEIAGLLVEYIQQFCKFTDLIFLQNWYIRILASLYSTKNKMNLFGSNNKTPSLLKAFSNSAWKYAQITNKTQQLTRLAKIEVALGIQHRVDKLTLNFETIMGIPTGNVQDPERLFSAVVGNNGHFELGGRLQIDYELTHRYHIHGFLDLQGSLWVKNKQYRTFDLYNKPWSRYVSFNTDTTLFSETNIPGVNVLTRKVSVRPFLIADFTFGLTMYHRSFSGELGYNIWGHHQERVDLQEPFPRKYGIAGSAPGKTASKSDISFLAPDDETFTPITFYDLDFRSAQAKTALTHTIYFTIGYYSTRPNSDISISGNFFREFQQKKGALAKWGASFKFMKSF